MHIFDPSTKIRSLKKSFTIAISLAVSLYAWPMSCRSQVAYKEYGVNITSARPTNYTVKDGKAIIHSVTTSHSVFFKDGYVIYQLDGVEDFTSGKTVAGSQPFFIQKQGSEMGYYFSSVNDQSDGQKLNADSFIRNNGIGNINLDYPKQADKYRLAGTIVDENKGVIQKFIPIRKMYDEQPDTLFYHFSSTFPKIDFSISKKLDSLNKMKFYKMRFFFKKGYSKEKAMDFPDREMIFELKFIDRGLPENVLPLFYKVKGFQVK